MTDVIGRVGILWRGDGPATPAEDKGRLTPLFDALASHGVSPEPVIFSEEMADDVRRRLLELDGVLVWVDPLAGGRDRSALDPLLREVAADGVWVSAHPDVILKMGTKEVLVRTRDLGCGSDVHVYRTRDEFRSDFPPRLASAGPRVLKPYRGNGGIGVWKVMLAAASANGGSLVDVQDAQSRGVDVETIPPDELLRRCDAHFAGDGGIVDQPFQPRIADGMIRCYMVRDEVVGFAHQSPNPAHAGSDSIFGLPAKKTMFDAVEAQFAALRSQMESSWLPAMERLLDVDQRSLPMLWDADFLYGPKTETGADTYVLCEINVSCVTPFPDAVPEKLAAAVAARLASK